LKVNQNYDQVKKRMIDIKFCILRDKSLFHFHLGCTCHPHHPAVDTKLKEAGAANAAIAAAYYLRIVATIYFQPAAADASPDGGWGALTAAALCGVLVVACGVLPGPAMNSASDAEETLRHRAPIVRSVPPALPAIAAADPELP
jgi:hypothetical protein